MTVAELIALLRKAPPDALVVACGSGLYQTDVITDVEVVRDSEAGCAFALIAIDRDG